MCPDSHRCRTGAVVDVALGPALALALALSVALLLSLPATAQTGTQVVTASPSAISVEPGGALSVDVLYDTTPQDATLTGLGISIHWDSTKLADPEISSVLGTALVGQQILDDSTDLDGDPATDPRALVAWLDAGGNWPGALPKKLYTATFSSGAGLTAGSTTTIRFSTSSSAAGWNVSLSPITITGVAAQGSSTFHILTPCRIFDTRAVGAQTTGQPLPASDSPDSNFILTGGTCGVPVSSLAVSANVTVTQAAAAGSISVYPGGSSPGETTTTSFGAGRLRANNAILKLSSAFDGAIRVRNRTAGTAHVIVDVNGYFLASSPNEITVDLPGLPAGAKPLVLVRIPAGTFNMGAPATELNSYSAERPVHQVALTQDYYLGKYEVTQAQWLAVMGTAMPTSCGSYGVGNDYPVYCVSWSDITGAGGFLEMLNALAGDTRFRLPTEAEWERAARAGTQTRFSFGDALDSSNDWCGASAAADPFVWWCGNDTTNASNPVGTKLANQLGLFDMHGNVWEWVQDWYDATYYSASPPTDPQGPSSGSYRVFRGGVWYYGLHLSRAATRSSDYPTYGGNGVGFRLSRSH